MTPEDILNLNQTPNPSDEPNSPKNDDNLSAGARRGGEAKAGEKLILIKQTLEKLQKDLNRAFKILEGADTAFARPSDFFRQAKEIGKITEDDTGRIIEGVFDGQNMQGPDAKQYSVPANYASKSKLVEGDILKLTIQPNGTFVYKQIGPAERTRLKGVLIRDSETDNFQVLANAKKYKVILASVTYFKGEEGDEAIILVPKDKQSTWAAVENIIKRPHNISTKPDDIKLDLPKPNDDLGL